MSEMGIRGGTGVGIGCNDSQRLWAAERVGIVCVAVAGSCMGEQCDYGTKAARSKAEVTRSDSKGLDGSKSASVQLWRDYISATGDQSKADSDSSQRRVVTCVGHGDCGGVRRCARSWLRYLTRHVLVTLDAIDRFDDSKYRRKGTGLLESVHSLSCPTYLLVPPRVCAYMAERHRL